MKRLGFPFYGFPGRVRLEENPDGIFCTSGLVVVRKMGSGQYLIACAPFVDTRDDTLPVKISRQIKPRENSPRGFIICSQVTRVYLNIPLIVPHVPSSVAVSPALPIFTEAIYHPA